MPSTRLAAHDPPRLGRHDAVFPPNGSFRIDAGNVHDIELDGPGVVLANTRFSGIARAASFVSLVGRGAVAE